MISINSTYSLQLKQVITLDFVCSRQMLAEHDAHFVLYLASFVLGQNEQRFLFPFPEWLGTFGRASCGRGPIIV